MILWQLAYVSKYGNSVRSMDLSSPLKECSNNFLFKHDQWLVSLYIICHPDQSFYCHTGGDTVKFFWNCSSALHQKQLALTHQVLFPNTSVVQETYDSHLKVKLSETISTFHFIIQINRVFVYKVFKNE